MKRLGMLLVIFLCFELGVLVLFLPWSGFWERNFFLQRYPSLIPIMLNPFVRGAISGLGILDILIAGGLIRRRFLLEDAEP